MIACALLPAPLLPLLFLPMVKSFPLKVHIQKPPERRSGGFIHLHLFLGTLYPFRRNHASA